MDKLKQKIQWLKESKPMYGDILNFYQKIREEQVKVKASLKTETNYLKKEWKECLITNGLPPFQEQQFPVDVETSIILFNSLCQVLKDVNPYASEHVRKIEDFLISKRTDLKELLKKGIQGQKMEQLVKELGSSLKVFLLLIQKSMRPSIEAVVEQLSNELDSEAWLKCYCPICGSLPYLSVLKDEIGKRFLLCSYCEYQWQIDRLMCPFCSNIEQESLHYFYGEGEEFCRIYLCDKCHQYIKTIDLRNSQDLDPSLEDLTTLHLDILALQRGYIRPYQNPYWTIQGSSLS